MDKLNEIKKLKKLLDDGIINEEDFKNKKAQLLGLSKEKTNIQEDQKSKSLDDYEKGLLEQIEEEKLNVDDSNSNNNNNNDDYYQKEKLKFKAKLDAEEEIRIKRKAETKAAIDRGTQKTKRILKWILAVFLWLAGIGSFATCSDGGLVYIPLGIIFLLQGCMACPAISDKTQKYNSYTAHKTFIVWITVILSIVLISVFPPKNTDTTNNINIESNETNNK